MTADVGVDLQTLLVALPGRHQIALQPCPFAQVQERHAFADAIASLAGQPQAFLIVLSGLGGPALSIENDAQKVVAS